MEFERAAACPTKPEPLIASDPKSIKILSKACEIGYNPVVRLINPCTMTQPSTAFAPDSVMRAALDVLGYACAFVRNATLSPDASIKMINDLMEAIHDIPFQLKTWDDERINLLRLHLRCFDSTMYPGSPDFLNRFEMLLSDYNQQAEADAGNRAKPGA